jgi:hypothetical protein
MATYGTDLTLITDAYTGTVTVVEMGAPYALGNIGAIDIENFIEGAGCITQETKNAVAVGASVAFNNLSAITFATDDVVFMWAFFAVGADLYTYANSGHVMIIGSSTTAYDAFAISGSDRTPNPRGGWYNYAVDPTLTPTTAYGGGSTAHQYFGSGVSLIAKISKGNPHAIDAIRYGRGEIYCTGTDCSFTGMAAENDDNITNQNRWGLFQDVGGSYLWKGLMSFGQAATSATFSHTGATIAIDDMYHVYSHFNKIEFNNASTSVTWNNVTFNSLSTVSPGSLEMIDNCTVAMTACTFNAMSTFIFDSNATVTECSFNSCGVITAGDADFSESKVLISTVAADTGAVNCDTAYTDTNFDGMTFSKGTNAHHAIDFSTSVTSSFTLRNIEFTGFGSTDDSNDSTVRFLATTGSLTLSLVGCTVNGSAATPSNFSVDDAAGITVTISIDPVTTLINIQDPGGLDEQNVAVYLEAADGLGDLPFEESVTISRDSGTTATVTHTAHGLNSNEYIKLAGIINAEEDNSGAFQVTVTDVDTYTYTSNGSGILSYTGTIIATGATIYGTTDASGNISSSRTYGANQALTGYARKSDDGTTYFKPINIDAIVNSSAGLTISRRLISDGLVNP